MMSPIVAAEPMSSAVHCREITELPTAVSN